MCIVLSASCIISFAMIFAGVVISYYLGRQIEREERKKDLNKDSVVVISGACTGIGLMLAIKIATEHQCHIVIYDSAKNNPDGLIKEIEEVGGKGHFFECDVLNKDKMFHAIAMTLAKLQTIDIFINTGGVALEKKFEDYTEEEFKDIMQVNFLGPAVLIKEMLTVMKRQGKGHIVNVPYEMDSLYSDDVFAYCGAKTGLNRLLKGLQNERVERGVNITIVRSTFFCCSPQEAKEAVTWKDMKDYMERIYNGILLRKKEI